MEGKRYTEVLIDGKVYTLGGYEDEGKGFINRPESGKIII